MEPGISSLLGVGNPPNSPTAGYFPRIAKLTAHFGITGRGVNNDRGSIFAGYNLQYLGGRLKHIVAHKARGSRGFSVGEFNDLHAALMSYLAEILLTLGK